MLQEEGWGLGSVQSFDPDCDIICVQSLMALKTRAKDDKGKTYWVYPDVEVVDEFQRKNDLDIRPSVSFQILWVLPLIPINFGQAGLEP